MSDVEDTSDRDVAGDEPQEEVPGSPVAVEEDSDGAGSGAEADAAAGEAAEAAHDDGDEEEKKETVAGDVEVKDDGEEEEEPHPVQFITTDDMGTTFTLDEGLLAEVFGRAPPRMRVSVVSIVGRFRTGKSFLLGLMLRYLYHCQRGGTGDWFDGVGDKLTGSNNPDAAAEDGKSRGFLWKSGKERQTTGMWIWSHPFIRTMPSGEEVAVFLLDTQGMFDSKTGQMLTACIFGLSTLISSYEIYNVERRVGEDNLQHLALFSEYGRIGGSQSHTVFEDDEEEDADGMAAEGDDAASGDDEGKAGDADSETTSGTGAGAGAGAGVVDPGAPPFQVLEFLVRDAHIEPQDDIEETVKEMEEYLESVLTQTHADDLQKTREQIASCFEKLSCFELPHPGFEVEGKNYDGEVSVIRPPFKALAKYYIEKLFGDALVPKKIHGQSVNATQLQRFVVSYCGLFQNAQIFPAATDLLSATAEVNNRNAREAVMEDYKGEMDKLVGAGRPFVAEGEVKQAHKAMAELALSTFDKTANFGSRRDIKSHREALQAHLDSELGLYLQHNRDRDPFKDVEIFAIPLFLFVAAYILDKFTDIIFGGDSSPSAFFTNIYTLAFFLLAFIIGTRASHFTKRVKAIIQVFSAAGGAAAGADGGHAKQD